MFKVNKIHKIEIYADTTPWFTKEEIKAMLDGRLGNGNVVTIECPEWILRLWYTCTEMNKYYKNFNEWLDSYVTDEVDGLYDFAKNLGWVFENDRRKYILDLSIWNRVEAIIVFNNTVYRNDFNHQECAMQIPEFREENEDINLEYISDEQYDYEMQCAIEITDYMFKNNDMTGYSLYQNKKGDLLLLAHYPQNLKKDLNVIRSFAKEIRARIGTFVNEEKLCNEYYLIK